MYTVITESWMLIPIELFRMISYALAWTTICTHASNISVKGLESTTMALVYTTTNLIGNSFSVNTQQIALICCFKSKKNKNNIVLLRFNFWFKRNIFYWLLILFFYWLLFYESKKKGYQRRRMWWSIGQMLNLKKLKKLI